MEGRERIDYHYIDKEQDGWGNRTYTISMPRRIGNYWALP